MPQLKDPKTGRFTSVENVRQDFENTIEALQFRMALNAFTRRVDWFRENFDKRRDINDECGFPQTREITIREYKELYDREPIAARVVELMPRESWCVQPSVYETEDMDQVTPFEESWQMLGGRLLGPGWHQSEEGSCVWEYLRRVDELSGIGSFGCLLLGVAEGEQLREPIASVEMGKPPASANPEKLLFIRALDESLVQITKREDDANSPRFGQPTEYSIRLENEDSISSGTPTVKATSHLVHWSRVLHVADNRGSSEIFGVPRMRPVFNRLLDLRKLYGGSAEMYWKGAFFGLSIESLPQLGGDIKLTTEQKTAMREQMENFQNGLQRYMTLLGMSAKSLAPQVVDPTPQINVQIESICVKLGVPKRIFMGSERGELASSQDDSTWNDRLQDRQKNYLTPRLIVPFVDRLILMGVLPVPKEGYKVVWPDLYSLSDKEKADIAMKRTEAMAKYVGGNVEAVMTPLDYLTRVLGMPQEEALEVVEAAMEAIEEKEEEMEEFGEGLEQEEETEESNA